MSSKGKGKAKGKEIAGKGSSTKRKRDDDKTGGRKRTNRAVLQFFEDAADEASDYDTSDFDEDFAEDEKLIKPAESSRHHQFPVKEEELSGDELERVLEDRYRRGSGYVTYAEDGFETKTVGKNSGVLAAEVPVNWKVKCKIGRERHSIFCLMQKYVDLNSIGNKLPIVSAFTVEHVRGFIFVEAVKQFEVIEACKQLPDVYYSLVTQVPESEFSQLLAVRTKLTEVGKGTWVRLKNGTYKGDLGQVVGVGDSRKKATVKLIPRVDFQALASKFGAGTSTKRSAIPKPRLISASDLEEFRPLIQSRRDRDTGMQFEVLDSLMLKDGFLYKKVSIDSLRLCDINPSAEELQKFRSSNSEDSGHTEFLSQLYGEKKEQPSLKPVQVGGKGEGTSGSKDPEDIEVHDLVIFGKRDFGMVIGMEKDENYKILKYGSEGSVVVSLAKKDLKNLNLEKKFNALDHRMKTIFVNDVVKILDGLLKDKEGVVKQIYRGIIFMYDQNDMEDNAYFCSKAQLCEKVKHNDDICLGKNDEAGTSGFEDIPSSPKTPLSTENPWQSEEPSRTFNRREQEDGFSVGQSLRIRVGPLKGYLCRVLAVRRSEVTVKLDSRQKVLTVKTEHLSEVRGKSFATSTCDDSGLDSIKPFDFLGNNDGNDSKPEDNGWGGVGSGERSSGTADWGSGNPGSSGWGQQTSVEKVVDDSSWGQQASVEKADGVSGSSGWGEQKSEHVDMDSSWGKPLEVKDSVGASADAPSWGKSAGDTSSGGGWGTTGEGTQAEAENSWGKVKDKGGDASGGGGWGSSSGAVSGGAGWGGSAGGSSGGGGWGTSSYSDSKDNEDGGGGRGRGRGGRGGGGNCFKCGESGHMSRECPSGGGRGGSRGGGGSCYKCGEPGHMSRECPSGGGGGGGGNCFKCGESGHMSRECPSGGGGGKGNCFKCGESGHMSRECPSGGGCGGRGNCFKCGESGHMSRECPTGGGGRGGGGNCYSCGESGHMSRECPSGGGGGRGRGRSFGGGRRQSWNSDSQDKPSWGSSGGGWGTKKDSEGGGSGWGGSSGGGGGGWKSLSGGAAGNGGWGSGSSGGVKDNEGGGGGSGWGGGSSGGAGGWGSSSVGSTGGAAKDNQTVGWGSSTDENSAGAAKESESGGGGGWGGGSSGGGSGGWGSSAAGNSGGAAKESESGGSGWGGGYSGGGSGGWGSSAGGTSNGDEKGKGVGWGSSAGGTTAGNVDAEKTDAGGSGGWGNNNSAGGGDSSGAGWGKSGGW